MGGHLRDTRREGVDALVADSQSNAIIIDFYANWCNLCKILTPRLVKAMEGKTRVKLKKIDVDAFPNIAEALKVSSLPTIMLLHRGKFCQMSCVINPKRTAKSLSNERRS